MGKRKEGDSAESAKVYEVVTPVESAKVYEVVTPVDHDNQRYEPGSSIELNAEDAKGLLEVKAIKEVE